MNRRAFLRLAAGFKFGIDQQIPGFTVGTYAGPGTVNGANQSGSSLLTHGWTSGSVSLNPGDRFTIAGVYKVNPSGTHVPYSGAANLMQFVVTQSVTDTTGAATRLSVMDFLASKIGSIPSLRHSRLHGLSAQKPIP